MVALVRAPAPGTTQRLVGTHRWQPAEDGKVLLLRDFGGTSRQLFPLGFNMQNLRMMRLHDNKIDFVNSSIRGSTLLFGATLKLSDEPRQSFHCISSHMFV